MFKKVSQSAMFKAPFHHEYFLYQDLRRQTEISCEGFLNKPRVMRFGRVFIKIFHREHIALMGVSQ